MTNAEARIVDEEADASGLLAAIWESLRPRQWFKNGFVLAGVVFAQKVFTPSIWVALETLVAFCALSSAAYLINDVADRHKDRLHPVKRRRPIAAGRLRVSLAVGLAVVLAVGSLAAAVAIGKSLALVALAYVGLQVAYSFWLKHLVIVDVLAMAIGFVLRAVAGAVAIDVDISGWLLICTLLVALFLALGKRRHEHNALRGDAALHRSTLGQYNQALLDQMIAMVTASTITSYALYTMAPDTVAKFQTHLLPLTLPFVLYGIFRYLYLLYRRDLGGNPSDLMLADRPLLLSVGLRALATLSIIYGRQLLRWL